VLTEQEIIEGCKRGKPACQEALYKMYSSRMMAICLRYAKTQFEAEDTFHEAFVNIFNKIDTFKEGSFPAWIRRIFVNTAINNYRRNKNHYDHHDTDGLEINDESQMDGIQELTNQELINLINELPEGYRMIFNLYVIEGFNHREIAEMLNIAEGTSKSQLSKAKNMLKKKLEQLNSCLYAS
jgi:RNA polymerase sigma factor (sigma-70 family)